MLYDVSPVDLLALTGVVLLLLVVATVASYIPAARASRLDPMSTLRSVS
jgi:ABC-type lipoprotein release transport system permease subunit